MLEQGRADRTEHHAFDTAASPGTDDKQLGPARSPEQCGASAALRDMPAHDNLRVCLLAAVNQPLENFPRSATRHPGFPGCQPGRTRLAGLCGDKSLLEGKLHGGLRGSGSFRAHHNQERGVDGVPPPVPTDNHDPSGCMRGDLRADRTHRQTRESALAP